MANAQFRIIAGALYRREPQPYAYDIRIHDLGNGHGEGVSLPRHAWHEVGLVTADALAAAEMSANHIWQDGEWVPYVPSQQELLDRAARNRERSARRSRTQVRRLVKAKSLTTMLTLTYRENMEDRAKMARDFDVFMKRIRRVFPGFEYVCVFERQKRGAWHAHIAVPRVLSHYLHKGTLVKSYDLLRAVWRAVVGEGNVDVSKAMRRSKSLAKLAGYLSKYIGKTFDENHEGDSYRASGKALPKPTITRCLSADPSEARTQLIYAMEAAFGSGSEFHLAFLDGGGFFYSLSP